MNKITRALIGTTFALAALLPAAAGAADAEPQDALAYFHSSEVVGESKKAGFRGWFELTGVATSITNPTSATTARGRTGGAVQFGKVEFGKYVDRASIGLLYHAMSGKVVEEVEIAVLRNNEPFMYITLGEVIVSSISSSQDGDDEFQELVELDYRSICWTYVSQNRDGKAGGEELSQCWDVASNRAL